MLPLGRVLIFRLSHVENNSDWSCKIISPSIRCRLKRGKNDFFILFFNDLLVTGADMGSILKR